MSIYEYLINFWGDIFGYTIKYQPSVKARGETTCTLFLDVSTVILDENDDNYIVSGTLHVNEGDKCPDISTRLIDNIIDNRIECFENRIDFTTVTYGDNKEYVEARIYFNELKIPRRLANQKTITEVIYE